MKNRNRHGSAMILAMVVGLIMIALAFAGIMMTNRVMEGSGEVWDARQVMYTAEAGAHAAVRELNDGTDKDGDGLGVIPETDMGDGGTFEVKLVTSTADSYVLRSFATVGERTIAIEVVLRQAVEPIVFNTRAAVVSFGDVTTKGNITIDGRNWNSDNTAVTGPGVDGVSGGGTVSVQGSSSVGGNGIAPINNGSEADGVLDENVVWADGIDNDGDGDIDEESYDGLDNDGDGQVDEDVDGFPSTPDAILGLVPGTLLAHAQSAGTYFATEAELTAYITANGGNIPGGEVIYLDFATWQPAQPGTTLNDEPSIIVHHNAAGTAKIKNLYGSFKGILLCDAVDHINAGTMILGSVINFTPPNYDNIYGNGNATIRYSSEALGMLPSVAQVGGAWTIMSWRQMSAAEAEKGLATN